MSRHQLPVVTRLALAAALVAGASVATVQVAVAGDPCFHSMDRPAPTTGATLVIAIGDCTFGPTVSHVAVGSEVVWTNTSSQAHEVVGANLAWGAHDELLQPGDTVASAFPTAGVYPYTCMLHPGMTGAIVVGAAATADAAPGAASVADAGSGTGAAPASAVAPDGVGTALIVGGIGLLATVGLLGMAFVVRRQSQGS